MRTGRKNRRKNRKSRSYIVPICLALSGTLMAGTATADPDIMCGGVIKNEYKTPLQAKNGLQWVKVDGDTVTLHNIGINNGGWDSNPNSGIPDYYYFTGVDASEKSIIIDWQDDSNR